jgi:hypothetical protein
MRMTGSRPSRCGTGRCGRPRGAARRGRSLREQALPRALAGSYLEAVLLIELDRMAEAWRVLDDLNLPDPVAMAELNILAGRPETACEILALAPALPPEPTWSDLGRRAGIALDLGDIEEADELAGRAVAAFEQAPVPNDYYRALAVMFGDVGREGVTTRVDVVGR